MYYSMKSRKLKRNRNKSRKKYGGANSIELNRSNCKSYWRMNKDFCYDDAEFTNYPGLFKTSMFSVPTRKKWSEEDNTYKQTDEPSDYKKRFIDWTTARDSYKWVRDQRKVFKSPELTGTTEIINRSDVF